MGFLKSNSFLLGASLVVGLGVFGCGRNTDFLTHFVKQPPEMFSGTHKLTELQRESRVDILFVIDNSGSMGSHQQALIKNADDFINSFVTRGGLDWKIGILSTDVSNPPFIGFTPKDPLNYLTPDAIKLFKDAVDTLGTNGDTTERTFAPVEKWLKQYPDFNRTNAVLALVMITDAEEQSQIKAADFISFLAQTKTSLKNVVAYGVYAAQDFGCTIADSMWNYAGSPYEEVIKATSGSVYPLCKDFGVNLAALGKDLFRRVSRPTIQLKTRPVVSTLKVTHHGEVLKGGVMSEGGVWVYDFDQNAILFNDLDFAKDEPEDLQEVEVAYEVAGA